LLHFGISPNGPPRQVLDRVTHAFAGIPYENITKIIKRAEVLNAEKARRYPDEVVRSHIMWGSGGTCFSLTSTLAHLVRALGWRAEYILAHRRYGSNTHCALLVWIDGVPHILDPGYLIVHPIAVPDGGEREIITSFNKLILTPEQDPKRLSLSTLRENTKTYRLSYKISPVDEGEFLKAWDDSFDWDMMRYPLLTRTSHTRQLYLNGARFQVRDAGSVQKRALSSGELVSTIASEFRIHPSLVARAVSILMDRGEMGGKTARR